MLPFVHQTLSLPGRPWSVAVVCDADGGGVLAAFTTGLHTLGLPELLLPAAPDDGATPAEDPLRGRRRLGHRSLGLLLDEVADGLVGGDVVPGGALRLPWAGTGPLHDVRVGAFTAAADLVEDGAVLAGRDDRAGLPADRLVLPLTWSRVPAPRTWAPLAALVATQDQQPRLLDELTAFVRASRSGDAVDPLAEAAGLAAVLTSGETADLRGRILARGRRPGAVPARWRPTSGPTTDRFGPLGPLVVARAEQLLTADPALRREFADLALDAGAEQPRDVLGLVATLAATTGRTTVPQALAAAARDVTDLLDPPSHLLVRAPDLPARPWERTPRDRTASSTPPAPDVAKAWRRLVGLHVHGLLAVEAFADVLPSRSVAGGRATWLGAAEASDDLQPGGSPTDPGMKG